MALIYPRSSHASILSCYHGERLVGHLMEQGGKWKARSWPDETLIGIFATRADAETAVSASVDVTDEEFNRHEFVVRPCPELDDHTSLSDRLDEITEHSWISLNCHLFIYLEERGIHPNDAVQLIEAALQRYADEIPE
jgi:hypothetical protein